MTCINFILNIMYFIQVDYLPVTRNKKITINFSPIKITS